MGSCLACGRGRTFRGLPLLALLVAGGCQSPEPRNEPIKPIFGAASQNEAQQRPAPIQADKVETRDDIIAINDVWQPVPWLGDIEGRVVGFKVPVYFQSGSSGKGAFVPGTIRCRVAEIRRTARGAERVTLQTWEFDEAQALGFRVTRKAVTGYFYGFPLRWAEDLNLSGKEIEIQFEYQRLDGRLVTGAPKRIRVPLDSDEPLVGQAQVK